jgi:hypothetical protein
MSNIGVSTILKRVLVSCELYINARPAPLLYNIFDLLISLKYFKYDE